MPYTPAGVVSYGFPQAADPFTFTYLISGTFADDTAMGAIAGKAVELDTTAASTVKLATDGGEIFGRVFQGERRGVLGINVASVQRKFKEKLPAATGHGMVVGDYAVGAGAGLVKKLASGTNRCRVIETGTDYVVVEAF
jgi:hypothetical protein